MQAMRQERRKMIALFFSLGIIVGFLGYGFMMKLPHEDVIELHFKLNQVRDLALAIANSSDQPACFKEPDCPLNDGDGFDNHCNMKCPFVIANKIVAVIDGEKSNEY